MKNSPKLMFFFGILAFTIIMLIVSRKELTMESAEFWFYRVLTALASASISISIPGMLHINYDSKGIRVGKMSDDDNDTEPMTFAEKEPTITASGAIAVFVLVYLFNPLM
ncbi:hypothetical protein [Polaribacter sp.]|uniref:hypothetical protein n=1 Tax=Polaribacter sp. TaxID=1920175 RepID=UPI003EF1FDBB